MNATNMTDVELLKALKPMMVMENWECLEELLNRRVLSNYKQLTNLSDVVTLHRTQGKVVTLNEMLSLRLEAKAL